MQALSDDQQIEGLEGRMDRLDDRMDRLEKKVDDGFAEVRSESRADFRMLMGAQLTTVVAMVLGFAAILLQSHL